MPILEGEVSHVEIPRTSAALGITIVGGSDTPLRCVVVQVSQIIYKSIDLQCVITKDVTNGSYCY